MAKAGGFAAGEEGGCRFILDEGDGGDGNGHLAAARFCDAPRRPGSSYCALHHARCRVAGGSADERRQLREIEALAQAVGGRHGSGAAQPPAPLLRRLERTARAASRGNRSRIAQKKDGMASNAPRDAAAPSPERRQQGPVERLERTIADSLGNPSRPYRAVDTLAVMERRGSITAGMRQAGEDFRRRFNLAQLDPLRAIDVSRLRLGSPGQRLDREAPGLRIEAARDTVWNAIQAVGGIASPAGSCLWHVLGWQRSLKEWATEQGWSGRHVSQEAASGILVAALGALEAHFGFRR